MYLLRVRVERVLDVAFADDADVTDDLGSRAAQHVVLDVGERLARRHHDRLARVDSQRVHVLHVAHLKCKQNRCVTCASSCYI